MNQRADSWKKNLGPIVAKPLNNERRWLLSHTLRCNRGENGVEKAFDRVIARFSACWHRLRRILPLRASGNGGSSANKPSPKSREPQGGQARRGQVSPGLAAFLGWRGCALTGFRALAGLMLSGLPAATADSGSGLKNARHPGVSCDLFLIMQAVTRSTSGISALQSRNASGLQACCSSSV